MKQLYNSIAMIVIATTIGLAGCGKTEPEADKHKAPPKVADTVFGDLVATKERAKVDTEKAMEANKQKLEEAMKKQEEAAAP